MSEPSFFFFFSFSSSFFCPFSLFYPNYCGSQNRPLQRWITIQCLKQWSGKIKYSILEEQLDRRKRKWEKEIGMIEKKLKVYLLRSIIFVLWYQITETTQAHSPEWKTRLGTTSSSSQIRGTVFQSLWKFNNCNSNKTRSELLIKPGGLTFCELRISILAQ